MQPFQIESQGQQFPQLAGDGDGVQSAQSKLAKANYLSDDTEYDLHSAFALGKAGLAFAGLIPPRRFTPH